MIRRHLNALAEELHAHAKENGWHSDAETDDQFIERTCNNMHDEISELHEAWRNGNLRAPCDKSEKMGAVGLPPLTYVEEELADIIIRALDSAVKLRIDIGRAVHAKAAFNRTRPFRHGGKKS